MPNTGCHHSWHLSVRVCVSRCVALKLACHAALTLEIISSWHMHVHAQVACGQVERREDNEEFCLWVVHDAGVRESDSLVIATFSIVDKLVNWFLFAFAHSLTR